MKLKTKRILGILLSVLLLLGNAPLSVWAASAADSPAGTGKFLAAIEAPEPGSIAISTAAELDAIRDNLSGKYYLANDIDLSDWGNWTPIGDYSVYGSPEFAFSGVFDGQGHVIRGLTVTAGGVFGGLFGYAGDIVIKNVGLEDGKIESYLAGGLLGWSVGDVSISNCYNTGDVSGADAGGLVGDVGLGIGDGSSVSISDSYNTGDVSGSGKYAAGGLVGVSVNSVSISSSYNTGDVSCDQFAGGLLGFGDVVSISASYNAGDVSGSSAGGLVGDSTSISISNSYNTGDVSGADAGGLVGDVGLRIGDGSSTSVSISASYNTGDISGGDYAGGLLGYGNDVSISDSYNTGDLSGSDGYAGGLVGGGAMVSISNAYNAGDVSGSSAGGLVSSSGEGVSISASYNTGDISGGTYAGGLVSTGFGVSINNSYNTGDVSSGGDYAGGLVGSIGSYGASISSSYNTGDVSGVTYASGLVGFPGFPGVHGSPSLVFPGVWDTYIEQSVVLSNSIQATGNDGQSYLIGNGTSSNGANLARNDIEGNPVNDADQLLDLSAFYKQSTYKAIGWDFDETWKFTADSPYPVLRWQAGTPVEEPDPEPEAVITGITIASLPAKTAYTTGETLDLSGLAVEALYSDDSTVDITAFVSSDPTAGSVLSDAGEQTVIVSYRESNLPLDLPGGEWTDLPGWGLIDLPRWNTWTAEFTVTVTAPEPDVDYGSINVGPASIVQDHLSYIQVTYGAVLGNANADFALLDKDGQIVGASVKGVNGRAVIGITAPNEPGFYDVVAQVGGKTVAQGSIEVLPYNPNIWETRYSVSDAGTIVINFNEGIATKDKKYDGIVSVNGKVVKSYLDGDRSLVTDVAWDSLEDGTTAFSAKGIIYPRLYPSYSFTFTTTVEKP